MISHSDSDAADRRLAERAAQWLVTFIDSDMLPQARAEFAAWLKESPRHTEEFLLAMAVWKELDGLDPQRAIDVRTLLAQVREPSQPKNSPGA